MRSAVRGCDDADTVIGQNQAGEDRKSDGRAEPTPVVMAIAISYPESVAGKFTGAVLAGGIASSPIPQHPSPFGSFDAAL